MRNGKRIIIGRYTLPTKAGLVVVTGSAANTTTADHLETVKSSSAGTDTVDLPVHSS